MNKSYPPGRYERMGGDYSDTYGGSMIVAPENQEELIKWFRKEVPNPIETTWTVTDEMFEQLDEVGYFEGGHIWPEGEEDGYKTFRSEEEARRFLRSLESSDYEEYWMTHIFGDWEKEEYRSEIEDDIRDKINQEMLEDLEDGEEEIDEYDLDQRVNQEVESKLEEYVDERENQLRDERFEISRNDQDHSVKMAEEASLKILDKLLIRLLELRRINLYDEILLPAPYKKSMTSHKTSLQDHADPAK